MDSLDVCVEEVEIEAKVDELGLDESLPQDLLHIPKVRGEDFLDLPKDLYIPPEALEVFLEAFEGPLDLLLYLIKRQNLDILDIPIAQITQQYMEYINLMQGLRFELAAEYLLMAAMLAEIKSRMLLPKPPSVEGEEEDPRAELVRRLQEYERYKKAGQDLNMLPRVGRDIFPIAIEPPSFQAHRALPQVTLQEMLLSLQDVLKRATLIAHHQISREPLSIRERMSSILETLKERDFSLFTDLFTFNEGRNGLVVSFMALLELLKQSMIEIVQAEPFGPIHVKVIS